MLLAITIWIITIITTVLFAGRYWWFPESASEHGAALDIQFVNTLIVTGAVFILAQLALGYAIFRYQEKPDRKAHYSHGSNKIEIAWVLATTVLFFVMVLVGYGVWFDLYILDPPEDVLQVEVTGQQFAWNVRYAGPDGEFGRTAPELIDDAAGNPLGLDLDDPAAQDDIFLSTMAVPVNRPVEILLKAKDVTHALFVRELRIKQDAVPGIVVPLRFTPTKEGRYEIACAELCGLGHHRMRSFLSVLSEEEFAEWLREQSQF